MTRTADPLALRSPCVDTDNQTEITLRRALAAIRRRDQFAFDKLYSCASAPVYGLARTVTGDDDLALRATHDVLVEIWRGAASEPFPSRGDATPWLLAMSSRRAKEHARPMARSDSRWRVAHGQPRQVMRKLSDRARELLAALPKSEREPLVLACCARQSTSEIAAVLRVDEDTVKTLLRSALLSLRAALADR